ncbi:polyamine-modulated factor 1 [Gasterosteus aculeatus]
MEESEAATPNEALGRDGDEKSAVNRINEATGEASSQMPVSDCKRPDEAEGRFKRRKLFDKVMQKSLEKFIDHASFNRFASTFRPLYKKNRQRMESIHKQFIEELQRNIQEDISRLIKEGRLDIKLNELDQLEAAAKNNAEPAWRPSGVPEQDFCSFLMPYYKKQENYMRQELKKIQAENAALSQKAQAGRESLAQTEQRISTTVDEWKASTTELERMASSLHPADVFDV